jgi:hypothetical protein
MQISHATQAAPDRAANEDCVVTAPGFAVVLDGATKSPGVVTGCIHDVPWLVARLGAELARLLLTESRSLVDALASAIEGVMRLHGDTCHLANPDSPSSTVAIVRERGEEVDYLVLSDSPVVLRDRAGAIDVVHDDRLDLLPGYTVEIVREQRAIPRAGSGSPAASRRRPTKPSPARCRATGSTVPAFSPTAPRGSPSAMASRGGTSSDSSSRAAQPLSSNAYATRTNGSPAAIPERPMTTPRPYSAGSSRSSRHERSR